MAVLIWRRRSAPGARTLMAFFGLVALWSLGYAFELFSVRQDAMIFWTKVEYPGIAIGPSLWLVFALQFTGRENWTSRRNILLLLTIPTLAVLASWTNELHGYLYAQTALTYLPQGFAVLDITYGPAFWMLASYSYLTLICGTTIVLYTLFRSPKIYREQAVPLIIAVLTPWISNGFYLFRLVAIDITPIGFAVSGIAVFWGLFRRKLFEVVPVAREWVIESMSDPLIVVDRFGRVADANSAARKMLARERDFLTLPLAQVFSTYSEQMAPYLDQNDARGEVNLGSLETPQWFDLRISAILQKGAHLAGRVLLFHNINDRKHAEEMLAEARDQAMQASLMKSQLLTNVSHDLRNPLNTVMGYTEMLKEGTYGPLSTSQTAILDRILVSTQQVSTFVGDLLDQSLIDKGRLSLNLNSFRPSALIDAVRSQVIESAQNKHLDLNFEIDPRLPGQIVGDSKRLQQIIVNLVANAIKFTEVGFINTRLVFSDSEHWMIEVSDSGRGIPHEAQSYIFEPFRRIEETGEKKSSGAGLGLAIARHLVTMMSGTIQVESQVGFGSTFRVILPYQHVAEAVA